MPPVRPSVALPVLSLAVAGLLAAGCSSSGGSKSTTAPSSTPAGTTSSAAPSSPSSSAPGTSSAATSSGPSGSPSDIARLKAINLQSSDLPSTFTASPADRSNGSTSSDNDLRKKLVACTGQAGAPDTDKVATADSQNFSQGQIQASSSFDLYRSESDVSADLAQIMSPKAESCLNSALKASLSTELPAGTTVASSTFTLVKGSSGGPNNIVAQGLGVVKIVAQGKPATVYLGVAFITGPKLTGTVSYVGIDQNVDTSVAGKAVALVAERAAKG